MPFLVTLVSMHLSQHHLGITVQRGRPMVRSMLGLIFHSGPMGVVRKNHRLNNSLTFLQSVIVMQRSAGLGMKEQVSKFVIGIHSLVIKVNDKY